MQPIIATAKDLIRPAIQEDSIVADCTMGNGRDTLFLSSLVPHGHVYAFDIQPEALINTEKTLKEHHALSNVTLIQDCHSHIRKYISTELSAVMFNLGWLPDHDKSITTKTETTLLAIRNSMELLKRGGRILIVMYPGHEEGRLEGIEIEKMLADLDKDLYHTIIYKMVNVPECPYIGLIEKR